MRRRPDLRTVFTVLLVCGVCALVWQVYGAMASFSERSPKRTSDSITAILQKTLVQCYALEGSYPASLDYLAEHYGVVMDEEHYFYFYEPNGSNVRPTVWVAPK